MDPGDETLAGGGGAPRSTSAYRRAIDDITMLAPPAPDRLPPMLFLAALVHGILIIGVTFNAVLSDEFDEAISLEVTIVADPENNFIDTRDAKYLAQASQQGDGNTEESVRASAPAQSNSPVENMGTEQGDGLDESHHDSKPADQLISAVADDSRLVADSPREEPKPDESTAIALEAGIESTLPLPQDREATLLIQDNNPRQLVTSVDTRESRIAGYLDRWKRKIETIGVNYFPELGITEQLTGSPTLQVTINASGHLDAAVVRHSSGSRVLDQAAINILRRASPFDPFPEAIRKEYDQLVFAYKWEFSGSQVPATASRM
jgi:protein TonB